MADTRQPPACRALAMPSQHRLRNIGSHVAQPPQLPPPQQRSSPCAFVLSNIEPLECLEQAEDSLKGKTLLISGKSLPFLELPRYSAWLFTVFSLPFKGASRGIGLAIALRAARDGANVVIAAKTVEPHPLLPGTIFTAAADVEAAGGQALAVECDIRSEEDVQARHRLKCLVLRVSTACLRGSKVRCRQCLYLRTCRRRWTRRSPGLVGSISWCVAPQGKAGSFLF